MDKSYDGLREEAVRFGDDPDAFFGHTESSMHAISRDQLRALQEETLKYRFESLVDKIPMLQQLARKTGTEKIDRLEDVIPVLFKHTMYKAYPPVLLEKNRFTEINKFISKLTTYDLSDIDVSRCKSLDEWFDVMDKESELVISHSSGTSGTMSFLPRSRNEWDKQYRVLAAAVKDASQSSDPDLYCVYPYFRSGGSAHLRNNDFVIRHIVGDEEHLIAAYPGRMSSDVLYLAAKIRAARAKGELDRLEINPALMERLTEHEQLQQDMPTHLSEFFDRVIDALRGKRVYFGGTWNLLHNLAFQGLAKGEEGVFSPDSFILSAGGAKGMTPPDNWQEDVCRFMGIDRVRMAYGMSEVGASHNMCEEGHYHLSPVAITFVLDPDNGEPLPRTGRVTGRAAFFDLGAECHWGGFISGDEITVNWSDECPCGRNSHFIEGTIERYSDKRGGDDKISCAATENAHREAMDFLTSFE